MNLPKYSTKFPQVLRNASFKKFGYDPDTLTHASAKRVLRECKFCGKVQDVAMTNATRTANCRACVMKDPVKRRNLEAGFKKITVALTQENYESTSDEDLVHWFYSASINYSNGSLTVRLAGKHVPKHKALSVFKDLKLDPDKVSTPSLKEALHKKIMSGNTNALFSRLTYIMTCYRKGYFTKQGDFRITEKQGPIKDIFDRVGVKYSLYDHGVMIIRQGSFFIDGRWLHIG